MCTLQSLVVLSHLSLCSIPAWKIFSTSSFLLLITESWKCRNLEISKLNLLFVLFCFVFILKPFGRSGSVSLAAVFSGVRFQIRILTLQYLNIKSLNILAWKGCSGLNWQSYCNKHFLRALGITLRLNLCFHSLPKLQHWCPGCFLTGRRT